MESFKRKKPETGGMNLWRKVNTPNHYVKFRYEGLTNLASKNLSQHKKG